MRGKLLTWVGLAVSVAVVAYIADQFDLSAAVEAIATADLWWLIPAAVLYLGLFPLRGLRWAILLRTVKPIGVRPATEVLVIGAMANNIMPARLGDVARAYLLSRREKVPATTTFSNVLLERVIDGVTVVGLMASVLVFAPPDADWVHQIGGAMAVLFTVALGGSFFLALNERAALALAARILDFAPPRLAEKVHQRLALLVAGVHVLKSAGAIGKIALLSIAIWLLEVVVYALVQNAFGMSIPLAGLVVVMAVLTLGLTAPSAPGFVGVFEGLIIAAVGLYGVGATLAPAFAITMHVIHYVPATLLGLAYAWRSGLAIRELRGRAPVTNEGVEGVEWT